MSDPAGVDVRDFRRAALLGSTSHVFSAARDITRRGWSVPVVGVAEVFPDSPMLAGADVPAGSVLYDVSRGWEGYRSLCEGVSLLVSFLFIRKIPRDVWETFPLAVNFHPGPLPELRGLVPIECAIAEGRASYGVTCHHLSDGIDEGDIIARRPVGIRPDDTALTLFGRSARACQLLLRQLSSTWSKSGLDDVPRFPQGPGVIVNRAYLDWLTRPVPEDNLAMRARKERARQWEVSPLVTS